MIRDLDDYIRHIQNNANPLCIKGLAIEIQGKDKEIERFNNIINEKNQIISNIIAKIEKVVIETKIYKEDRQLSVEEILEQLYKAKDLGSDNNVK